MHILITGGTGLIGRAFIARYPQYQYTVLTRRPKWAAANLSGDITCIERLDALPNLNDVDAVINLAGEAIVGKRWSKARQHTLQASRWQVTQTLVDLIAASDTPPHTLLSGSAIGVYGAASELLDEASTTPAHDFPSEICARWEQIAGEASAQTRVVLLRTGVVLAKHAGALHSMLLPFKLGLGGRLGSGQQYMSWIHLQDQVDAMHHLLISSSAKGAFNLVAPKPVSNQVFTQTLARALRRPAILPVPAWVLRLMLGDAAGLLLDNQQVAPTALLASGYTFAYPQLGLALDEIVTG